MRISTKLITITLGSAVLVTGLVTSLVVELQQVATGYAHILQGPVEQAAEARRVQANFLVQVQDWKDILLRGQNPVDLATYTALFRAQQAKVKADTLALADATDDAATRQLLKDFLVEDDALGAKYDAAYALYVTHDFDYKAADAIVRGMDRGPSRLLENAVAELNAHAVSSAAAQKVRAIRQLAILLAIVGGLFLIDSVVYCSVLFGVLKRLGQLKAVSDRLAVADIEGLSIDISGHDEIGAIGDSLKGVEAALHEVLAVHAH